MEGSGVAAASESRFRGKASGSSGLWARVALEVLMVANAVAFLVASIVHFGVPIPLGVTTLADVTILPAGIAEGAIGVAFVLAATAAFARWGWAWNATVGAFLFGILGVLVGLSISLNDSGDASPANLLFHEAVLPVLVIGLVLVLSKTGRTGLGKTPSASRASP